jgi:hypothetical protein
MNIPALRIIPLFFLCLFGRADDGLVTSAGKYGHGDGKTWLEVSLPDPDHIVWAITFKTERVDPVTGKTLGRIRSVNSPKPYPVARDSWAFCFGADREVWFYDGKGSLLSYKDGAAGMTLLGTCSDPEIAKRAPNALQSWVKRKEPNQPPQPTPGS